MNQIKINKMDELSFQVNEAYKTLRTNIQFCGKQVKVITFTSCAPNEGKSTVVMEVGRAMAQMGKKVLIIDADIRKSVLELRYEITGRKFGLSECLSGQCGLHACLNSTNIENLHMILTGHVAPNPAELLGSELFRSLVEQLREEYDYILMDCPPLGSVIDAALVSTVSDGAVLVVASGGVSRKYAQNVKKQLEKSGCSILGVVLNKVDMSGKGYYGGYYRSYYGSYYGDYDRKSDE